MSSRKYAISGTRAVANPTQTLLVLISAATVRPCISDAIWGSGATPADNALEWILQRFTAAGTGTTVTPQALDPGDPAALASAKQNHTVEPTYTAGAILLDVPANQRGTPRFATKDGYELKLPATAANGAGLQPVNASFTGNVTATLFFEE